VIFYKRGLLHIRSQPGTVQRGSVLKGWNFLLNVLFKDGRRNQCASPTSWSLGIQDEGQRISQPGHLDGDHGILRIRIISEMMDLLMISSSLSESFTSMIPETERFVKS